MIESSQREIQEEPKDAAKLSVASWIILGLIAVIPTAFATGLSNFESLKSILLVGGVSVAAIFWGASVLRQRRLTMIPGRVSLLSLVFAGYALLACLWASNSLWGLWQALHFAALAGAALIVSAPTGRALRFDEFAGASALGAILAGLSGILDYAGVGIFTVIWDPAGPTGAFDNMEFGAAYYVLVLPLLLVAAIRWKGKARVVAGLALLLAGLHFSMLATWYWAGIFCAVASISAVVVGALRRPSALKLIASAVVLSGGVAVLMAFSYFVLEPDQSPRSASNLPRIMGAESFDEDSALHADGRAIDVAFSPDRAENIQDWRAFSYLIEVGAEHFLAQPLIGHGAGAWWQLQTAEPKIEHPFVARMFEHYPAFRYHHSAVIHLLVEYGLIGALLFLLWIISAIWVGLGAFYRHQEAEDAEQRWVMEHWALFCAAVVGVVFMLFSSLLALAPAALVWVVGLAVLARSSAGFNEYRGWSAAWRARAPADEAGRHRGAVFVAAGVALALGVSALIPTVLYAGSSLYRGRADQFMRATAYEQAIEAYQRSFRWYPAASDAPLNIGLASVKIAQLQEVEEWVDRAVKMRPHDARALILQGRLNLRRPDRAFVVDLGRRAVSAYPNSLEAHDLLISALDLQSRYDDAVAQTLKVIELDPPGAQLGKFHKLAADLYSDILRKPAKAREHYLQALSFTESRAQREKLEQKVEKLDEQLKEERRLREGKPPRPTPQDAHGHPD